MITGNGENKSGGTISMDGATYTLNAKNHKNSRGAAAIKGTSANNSHNGTYNSSVSNVYYGRGNSKMNGKNDTGNHHAKHNSHNQHHHHNYQAQHNRRGASIIDDADTDEILVGTTSTQSIGNTIINKSSVLFGFHKKVKIKARHDSIVDDTQQQQYVAVEAVSRQNIPSTKYTKASPYIDDRFTELFKGNANDFYKRGDAAGGPHLQLIRKHESSTSSLDSKNGSGHRKG